MSWRGGGRLARHMAEVMMRLISFAFEDLESGWTLDEMRFGPMNLLLGISGVGKSRILRSLRFVRDLGLPFGALPALRRCRWTLTFEPGDAAPGVCVWTGEVGALPEPVGSVGGPVQHLGVIREAVMLGDRELLRRDVDGLKWLGAPTVGLRPTRSALALIDDGEAPHIAASLGLLYFLDATDDLRAPVVLTDEEVALIDSDHEVQKIPALFSAQVKYYLSFYVDNEMQDGIWFDFKDLFDFVEVLNMSLRRKDGVEVALFAIRDVNSPEIIEQEDMAAGMLRTLIYLVHLHTAPAGLVLLVDDFENSMGVNCLGPMLEIFEQHSAKTQIVLTSHHPFVINNVREESWRIVQRRGAVVTVKDAAAFPGILSSSKQSAYTRLISSTAYDEGILPADVAAEAP